MKKILIIFVLTVVVSISTAIVAVLCSTGIQTSIINSINDDFNIEKASISLSSIELTNIKYSDNVFIEKLGLNYNLRSLLSKKIELSNVKIDNAKVNIDKDICENSGQSSANSLEKLKPFDIDFAWTISIDDLKANVSIDDKIFNISADNISVDKNLLPKFGNINIATEGSNLIAQVTSNASKEIILKSILEADSKKIVQLSVISNNDYQSLMLEANANFHSDVIKNILPSSIILPNFDAQFYAKADVKNLGKKITLSITGKSDVSDLSNISEHFKPLGDCKINLELNLQKNDKEISLEKFDLTFFENKTAIIKANLTPLKSINSIDLEQVKLDATVAVPSRIVNAFVTNINFDSDNICTKLVVHKNGDAINIATTSPVNLTNVNISKNDEPILEDFNAFIDFNCDIDSDITAKLQIDVKDSPTSTLSIDSNLQYSEGVADIILQIDGQLNPIITRVNSISTISYQDLKASGKSKIKYSLDKVQILSADMILQTKDGTDIANFALKSNIDYTISTGKIGVLQKNLFSINSESFPYALLKPLVPQLDIDKTSFNINVDILEKDVYKIDGDLQLISLFYKENKDYMIRNLSTNLRLNALVKDNKINLEILDAQLGEAQANFATFSASLIADISSKSVDFAKANVSTKLPQLFNQPILLKYSNISNGSADMQLEYEKSKLKADIKSHSITVRSSQNVVDSLTASIETDFKKFDVLTQIKSTAGNTIANATVELNSDDLSVVLDAQNIVVEDIETLSLAFKNPNYNQPIEDINTSEVQKPKKKFNRPDSLDPNRAANLEVLRKTAQRADSIAVKDTKAFWYFDKNINLDAKINNVVKDNKSVLQDVDLSLNVDKSKLNLSKLNLKLFGALLNTKSEITFVADREIPYEILPTLATLKGFAIGNLFDNKELPPMVGVFDMSAQISSTGNNVAHLFEYIIGNVSVKSTSDGTIRLLDKDTVVGAGTSIAGSALQIASNLIGNKVKELKGASDLIAILSQLDYSSANVEFSRNSQTYNYNLDKFELISKDIILSSKSGVIYFNPLIDFTSQEISIPVDIYVANDISTTFTSMGFAKKKADIENFYIGVSFQTSGTIANPTNNLLEVITNKSVTNPVNNILKNIF